MRFIAAALVFFFHTSLAKMLNPFEDQDFAHGYSLILSKAGWLGVCFFFILSGFVMTWSTRPGEPLGGFYRRRLLKIYPNHIVTWAITMVLFSATMPGISVWLPNLFLLHSWVPDLDTFVSINQPSWSLCSELLFYLLFPLLAKAVGKIPATRLWWWAGAVVAALVVAQIAIYTLVPSTPRLAEWPLSEWQWWLSYNFPPLRLFEFGLGMLMARILQTRQWIPISPLFATALTAIGYTAALFVPWQFGLNVTTVIPLALLITSVAAGDVRGRTTVLRSRKMVWLGEISFGFYLTHFLVLLGVQQVLDGRQLSTPAALLLVLAVFVLCQIAGWLLYVCVERPSMRRWGRPRRPRPQPTPAPLTAPRDHDQEPEPVG
ncbi:acyltransferase [Streptomyces sp. NPDC050315]|uniref:acyltransferase family protein n=1 Tax=Streptomyces sp. NPDC050315 TaxID=3155039 RepID=UPI0034480B5D